MTIVAVMSQPMRADYLVSYLTRNAATTAVALLSREARRTAQHLPAGVRVQIIDPAGSSVSREIGSAARRMRTRFVSWANSGSGVAKWSGDLARRMEQRLDRIRGRLRHRFPRQSPDEVPIDPTNDPIIKALKEINAHAPISTVVVFDLFDLPSALAFSTLNDVPVLVR